MLLYSIKTIRIHRVIWTFIKSVKFQIFEFWYVSAHFIRLFFVSQKAIHYTRVPVLHFYFDKSFAKLRRNESSRGIWKNFFPRYNFFSTVNFLAKFFFENFIESDQLFILEAVDNEILFFEEKGVVFLGVCFVQG